MKTVVPIFLTAHLARGATRVDDTRPWAKPIDIVPSFVLKNHIAPAPGFAHLHVEINLKRIFEDYEQICKDGTHGFLKKTRLSWYSPENFDRYIWLAKKYGSDDTRVQEARKKFPKTPYVDRFLEIVVGSNQRCQSKIDSFKSLVSSWLNRDPEKVFEPTTREKRALGRMIIALGSAIYTNYQLKKLEKNDEILIENIRKNEARIELNAEAIRIFNNTLRSFRNDTETSIKTLQAFDLWQASMGLVFDEMDRVAAGFEALTLDNFSPYLIEPSKLEEMINRMKNKVANYGYKILLAQGYDLFKYPVSHILWSDGTIEIFIHLPIVKTSETLMLYERLPFHWEIDNDSKYVLQPTEEEKYLAVSQDHAVFQVLREDDIDHCREEHDMLFCHGGYSLDKRQSAHCLTALFRSDMEEARDLCKFQFVERRNELIASSGTQYYLFLTENTEIHVYCPGEAPDSVFMEGKVSVKAKPGCRYTTPYHVFDGLLDLRGNTTIEVKSKIKHYIKSNFE